MCPASRCILPDVYRHSLKLGLILVYTSHAILIQASLFSIVRKILFMKVLLRYINAWCDTAMLVSYLAEFGQAGFATYNKYIH
jgi:hypothetical protein